MNAKKIKSLILISLLMLSSPSLAQGFKEVGIGLGHGTDINKWFQLNLIRSIDRPISFLEKNHLKPYFDIGFVVSNWESQQAKSYNLSATAMVRTEPFKVLAGNMFFEAGFGPHLITSPEHTSRLSTNIEFNSELGVGLMFSKQWSVLMRARHVSNGGASKPNGGVNVIIWQLHYRWE